MAFFHEAFALSPAFVRQEVLDGADDWFFYDILHIYKKHPISIAQICSITGVCVGNIRSVSYISDGKTLNVTFWLTAPFNKKMPNNHALYFATYIDADSDNQTGWNGIDYMSIINWNPKTKYWENIIAETSGTGFRVLGDRNYTDFNSGSNYVFMSIDLRTMNYPEQYRLLFLEGDQLTNSKLHYQTKIIDFVNTVHVPTPKFIISVPTSVNVTRGGSALIQVGVKSINPLTSIESIRPNVHLTFNKDRNYDNISLIFSPERANFSSENTAMLDSPVVVPTNAKVSTVTLPITASILFPSEFYGNPSENITNTSSLTIIIQDPFTIAAQQIKNWLSYWIIPLAGIPTTVVGLITGILGWRIGKRRS